jgi:hypothetical protein
VQKPGGFGILRDNAPWIHREGVLWHEPSHTDLLFVTFNRSEALFYPSTRCRDLTLSSSLFQWGNASGEGAWSPPWLLPHFVAPKLKGMCFWGNFDEGGTDCRD